MTTATLRKRTPPEQVSILSAGNIRASTALYQGWVGDKQVDLTYQEFDLLRLLIGELDKIVSYDELMASLWREESAGVRRRLGVVVCRLRAKLAGSWPYRLRTVRGRGYGLTLVEEPLRPREGKPHDMHEPA